MLVSLALGDANFSRRPCTFHFFCVDFFALGSKRKPHFQWNIGCVGSLALGLCYGMYISCCLCTFSSRLVVNAKAVSGGIWALDIDCINVNLDVCHHKTLK